MYISVADGEGKKPEGSSHPGGHNGTRVVCVCGDLLKKPELCPSFTLAWNPLTTEGSLNWLWGTRCTCFWELCCLVTECEAFQKTRVSGSL